MQELAKKQEEKYTGMLKEGSKPAGKGNPNHQNELFPINMNEDDEVSLELNGFYDYR